MRVRVCVAAALTIFILLLPAAPGADQASSPEADQRAERLPGVEIARALATATGIAITPLLGVSAVGAWHYYRADEAVRGELPWYTSRWFWIPGLLVALLLIFKDPLLGLIPGAKKPLDALDVMENKASAVLATPAVVPMFVGAFATAGATSLAARGEGIDVSHAGLVALPAFLENLPLAIGLTIGSAVFLAAFFCIWLAFHAINVLILLSPFGILDLFLRSVKLFVLFVLIASTFMHPYLGLLVALLILIASIPLAGWSFRLMVFGGVLATDLVSRRHRRETPDASGVRAFTASRVGRAPARTYGRVSVATGCISFSYRPWLVLPRRTLELPLGSYHLGRGVLCPLIRWTQEGQKPLAILRLPPRYRYHEAEIVSLLALQGVEDLPLLRGIKAAWAWLKEMVGRGSREAARLWEVGTP